MQTPESMSKWNECWVMNGNNIPLEWTPGKWKHLIFEHNMRICFQLSGSPTWSTLVLPSCNYSQPPAITALQITKLLQPGQTGGAATYCSWTFAGNINHSLQTEECLTVKEACEKCIKKLFQRVISTFDWPQTTCTPINRKDLDRVPVTCQALLRA